MRDQVAERAESTRVVLANEAPFRLGLLRVEPQVRQVSRGGNSETVEPRVMQVLVVLGHAGGRVVSRDELVERCWQGRIVTDDAVNRVLSRIRQIGAGIGAGSFTIETITRVGYRLTERVHALPDLPGAADLKPSVHARLLSRRRLLTAAGGVALLGAGVVGWRQFTRHQPNPRAVELAARGQLLLREGLPGQIRQAASYFEQATAIDPDYAEAWGSLALAYSHQLQGFDPVALASLPARIRSAAARADALQPGNPDAELALIFTTPIYRRWADKEQRLRRIIDRNPQHWLAHGRLALVLQQVGRFGEALEQGSRALEIEPMLPVSYALKTNALGALGRLQEADATIAKAQAQWPANPWVWFAAYNNLLFTGRPEQAAAFTMDPARQPSDMGPRFLDARRRLAEAVAGTDAKARDAAAAQLLALTRDDPSPAPFAARALALLGRGQEAERLLRTYLLGPGAINEQRMTDMLFLDPLRDRQPAAAADALLRDVGLAAYWAETKTRPDV